MAYDYLEISQAVGSAITNWQFVEKQLGHLFVHLSTCANGVIASAIYYSSTNVDQKISVVHNAARWYFDQRPDWLHLWGDLRGCLIAQKEVRNYFAHFSIQRDLQLNADTEKMEPVHMLAPNWFNPNEYVKQEIDPVTPFTVSDVKDAAKDFLDLRDAIKMVSEALAHGATQPPKLILPLTRKLRTVPQANQTHSPKAQKRQRRAWWQLFRNGKERTP
jgi:hypothetical protein